MTEKREAELDELRQVLASYNVYTARPEELTRLVRRIHPLGAQVESIREVAEHLRAIDRRGGDNVAPLLVRALEGDPTLKDALVAAEAWHRRSEGPGARDRRENTEREKSHPDWVERNLAGKAYESLVYEMPLTPEALARRLEVSIPRLRQLVGLGASFSSHPPELAQAFLFDVRDKHAWSLLLIQWKTQQPLKLERSAKRLADAIAALPPLLADRAQGLLPTRRWRS